MLRHAGALTFTLTKTQILLKDDDDGDDDSSRSAPCIFVLAGYTMERKEERIEQGVGVSGYMASFAGCPVNFKSNTFGVCEFKPPHGAFGMCIFSDLML